jgi:hypothetical protein
VAAPWKRRHPQPAIYQQAKAEYAKVRKWNWTGYSEWRESARFFQLESRRYAPAEGKVTVCEGRHGSITIEYRGRALPYREIPTPARPNEYAVRGIGARASRQQVRAEMRTGCESSLARSDPESATETGVNGGGRREAGIVGLALRFALNAAPFGLHRASLRARPTMHKQQNRKAKKGDISIEL